MKIGQKFCMRGHDVSIVGLHSDRSCKECRRENDRKYYRADPAAHIEQVKARYRKNPRRQKERDWKKYGILNDDLQPFRLVDFDRIYQIQKGSCRGCNRHSTELSSVLHVDHDHKTGIVRGLLCRDCNTALGILSDSPETLRRLISYLQKEAA